MILDIKKADTTRVCEISKVINETWRDCYKEWISVNDMQKYTDMKYRESNTLEGMSNGREYYIMSVDKEVVGICGVEQSTEKDLHNGYCSIVQLYVLPEYQKIGIGRKLLSHTLREMRKKGYKNALLWTQTQNAAARHFYEKIGFKGGITDKGTMFKKPLDIIRYTIEL